MTDAPRLAPPLMVLPGMDGTGELCRAFVDRMARNRPVEVVAYPRDEALGYPELIARTATRMPPYRYFLLAESFSGPIAIDIAAHDANVAGLILVSSFARSPLPRWLAVPARFIDLRRLPAALIEGVLLGSDRTPVVRERLAAILPTIAPPTMRARALAALGVDKTDTLRRLKCPLLSIVASKDLLLGSRALRVIRDARPDVRIELISGPHMLLATRAAETAAVVERFCAQMTGRSVMRSA